MSFRLGAGAERTQVAALAGLRVLLARVQTKFAGLQFADQISLLLWSQE